MLEVLIAIVVIAFGLLGLAGLQAFALQNNINATQRTASIRLANDMIDRMKANYVGVVNNNYDLPASTDYATQVASCISVGGCTSVQMAQNDAFDWAQSVAATLPGGLGIVCLDSTPNDGTSNTASQCDNLGVRYVVKLWWVDDRSQANLAGNLRRLVVPFNP
jgi:type IV pilus assembly protein PilV